MTENKRKKNTRLRAKTTHGYGSMKKHRGAGHRGGRGRAGSGKRGDVKKPSLTWVKGKRHYGKIGFTSHSGINLYPINIAHLESSIETLIKKGLAVKEKDTIKIDLSDMKFNKLLGSGKVTHKYEIVTKYASVKAIEKIESAGGKVILSSAQSSEDAKESEE